MNILSRTVFILRGDILPVPRGRFWNSLNGVSDTQIWPTWYSLLESSLSKVLLKWTAFQELPFGLLRLWSHDKLQHSPVLEQTGLGQKGSGKSDRTLHLQPRPSPEADILMAESCFYVMHCWSTHSSRTNSWNRRPGLFLLKGSGFPRCLFGLDLPWKAHPWNSLGLLGQCSLLDGPRQCG